LFAYGSADATASPNPIITCLIYIQTGFTLLVPAYPGCPGVLVVKGKVFPYSLPSVGPGADPGVQAVSPQVT